LPYSFVQQNRTGSANPSCFIQQADLQYFICHITCAFLLQLLPQYRFCPSAPFRFLH
jgi:hypothetical protein